MPQLKTLQWWPTNWLARDGRALAADEVRKHGVLAKVGRSSDTLTLVVDCRGVECTATVSPDLPEDTLILLRHILLQRHGEPMTLVEDLDIDLRGMFPVVKSKPWP